MERSSATWRSLRLSTDDVEDVTVGVFEPCDLNVTGDMDITFHVHVRINLDEEWEARWWTKKGGITPGQLKAAVAGAGSSAPAVADYLGKRN